MEDSSCRDTAHTSRSTSPQTAVIAGGGLAGVAAAVVLAERGVSVVLAEREPFLGGRAGAWTDRLATGESFEMERGFHAFFRQYYNLQALLRRIDDGLTFLEPLEDYPILGPGGQVESFSGLPNKPPWNVVALTKRTPTLGLRDLMGVNGLAALSMLRYERGWTYGRYDDQTAGEYLDSLSFPPDARRMLFDVFAHSFFNPEEAMSAGELLMMFHFYFSGNPEGLIFDVSKRPFSKSIWGPLGDYMTGLGVDVRTGCTVSRVAKGADRRWSVDLNGEMVEADLVVLALTVPGLQAVVAESPDLDDAGFRRSVEGLALTHPFAVWRLWFDRPANPDRQPFAGTTGVGSLDNISLYNLFEDESRSWAERTGGSVVELHAYAVDPGMDEPAIREDLLHAPPHLLPRVRRRPGRRGALPDPPRLPGLRPGIPRRSPRRSHPARGDRAGRRLCPPADSQRADGARGGVGLSRRQPPPGAPGRQTRAHPLDPAPRPLRPPPDRDGSESHAMSKLLKFGPALPDGGGPRVLPRSRLATGQTARHRPRPRAGTRPAARQLVCRRRIAPSGRGTAASPDRRRGPCRLAGRRRAADRPGRLSPHGGVAVGFLRSGGQAGLSVARAGSGQGGARQLEEVRGPRRRRPQLGPDRSRGSRDAAAGARPTSRHLSRGRGPGRGALRPRGHHRQPARPVARRPLPPLRLRLADRPRSRRRRRSRCGWPRGSSGASSPRPMRPSTARSRAPSS